MGPTQHFVPITKTIAVPFSAI